MNNKEAPIHSQMTIEEILSLFPQKAQRLSQEITNAGLHCIGCGAASWETLEAGMMGHGMGQEEIDRLVKRLNALLEEADQHPDKIEITPRAASKYLSILEAEGKQGWGLRFSEKVSGCNGFEYILDFSKEPTDEDEVFISNGISIHVKKEMVERMLGSEIDYIESLQSSGFKVSNPNVRSACGCGSSHGY